jgi:hypothetical protein
VFVACGVVRVALGQYSWIGGLLRWGSRGGGDVQGPRVTLFEQLNIGSLANVGFVGMVREIPFDFGVDRALRRGSSGVPIFAF